MHEDEDLPQIVIVERGGGAGTFLLGALVGAGLALLLAPRAGRETQAELAGALGRLRDAAGDRVDGARLSVAGWVGESRASVSRRVDAVRGAVEDRVDQARTAVADGRDAARQARGELQRRVDEAKAAYRAGQRGEIPSAPRLESAAPLVDQEVVITGVETERDAGDLAGGAPR